MVGIRVGTPGTGVATHQWQPARASCLGNFRQHNSKRKQTPRVCLTCRPASREKPRSGPRDQAPGSCCSWNAWGRSRPVARSGHQAVPRRGASVPPAWHEGTGRSATSLALRHAHVGVAEDSHFISPRSSRHIDPHGSCRTRRLFIITGNAKLLAALGPGGGEMSRPLFTVTTASIPALGAAEGSSRPVMPVHLFQTRQTAVDQTPDAHPALAAGRQFGCCYSPLWV